MDLRAEQPRIVCRATICFRPRSATGRRSAFESRRTSADRFAGALAMESRRRLYAAIQSAPCLAPLGEETFDSRDRALSQILFRGCDESCFVALLLLERAAVILVMTQVGVCAQCASTAHDTGYAQLDYIPMRVGWVRRRPVFRFVIQSAECAPARDRASEPPTTRDGGIVRKPIRDNEKRLSLESGRCIFAGSRVTKPSEVAGQKVRLAHLVTPDSAA